ncbi:MAG: hypothetical protein IJV49_00335 [Aeriscardovia sp.]|nr:hypothetical protein [Aeriscardovia sp.]
MRGSTHGRTSGLLLSPGSRYRGNGADFQRMAVACPRAQLDDALERLKKGVDGFLGQ